MRKVILGLAVSSALLAAGTANAAHVSLWINQGVVAGNTTFANVAALGAADAETTVSQIFFDTNDFGQNSDNVTIDQFLGTSIGGVVGGHAVDNTVFEFTGSLFLNAGDNSFVVAHDDGLQLKITGIPGLVVDAPGPTGEVETPFNVNAPAAGNYDFDMVYGECCSGPAVIKFVVNDATVTGNALPEPATWGLMLAGFGGMGAMMRRRRAAALTA